MEAYSQNLREQIVRAVDQGYQQTEIFKPFGVSQATIKRYLKQRRKIGHLYIEQVLAPRLAVRQIVLMDNLAAHKSARVKEVIRVRECQLLFFAQLLAEFLTPAEETFSKLKTCLRRVGSRTREALQEAIGHRIARAVTSQDAQGRFQHGGYFPQTGG